jgi:HD-GYP domain-containing protein (c-di-GMP phosphodiesterase class II)
LLRTSRSRLGVLHLDRSVSQQPFTADDLRLADAIAAHMSTAIESAQALQEKQRSLFIQSILVLAQAIELRDEYTGGHTQRVTDYSLLLAEELKLSSADRHAIKIGAPLHDIGKIGINDAVLRKQGRLSADECEHMKTHTGKGASILGGIPDLEFIVPIVRSHHEWWDGRGYPDGLAGGRIPRLARLVAVADTFDAITSDRPYRLGMPADRAFAEIEKGMGAQFDPECASAFLGLRPRIEQLLSESQAIVVTMRGADKLGELRQLAASVRSA